MDTRYSGNFGELGRDEQLIGLILALVAGFIYVISITFVRKGMHRSGESYSPVPIAVFVGTVIIGLVVLASDGFEQLASLSWLALGSLVGAGVIHFILGRMLGYIGLRLIGANRTVPISASTVLIAVLLGVFFLGEPMTITLALAILLIMGGIILIGTSGSTGTDKSSMPAGSLVKGVLVTLAAALCWGVTPILIKIGLREIDSPLLGAFVSYAAASIIIGVSLLHPVNNRKLRRLSRASLVPFLISALATTVAQILRFSAINYSPVSLVVPVLWANSLFIFPLSFLMNRKIEAFNLRMIMGAITIVAGIFMIFQVV